MWRIFALCPMFFSDFSLGLVNEKKESLVYFKNKYSVTALYRGNNVDVNSIELSFILMLTSNTNNIYVL